MYDTVHIYCAVMFVKKRSGGCCVTPFSALRSCGFLLYANSICLAIKGRTQDKGKVALQKYPVM